MALETNEDSDQPAYLYSLIRVCNYSQRIQEIKRAKSSVSEHIAHVDLCSD